MRALERDDEGARLRIADALAPQLREGDSVAVNGVCLTATARRRRRLRRQAMAETLRALVARRSCATGSPVNLELRCAPATGSAATSCRGTSTGPARSREIREEGISRVLEIECEPRLLRYLVEKGSVALDGVSLTVSALSDAASPCR